MKLNICFDLGSDTLKIVYAYKDEKRKVHLGKLNSRAINQSAIPANAFYDEFERKWIFGSDIDDNSNESFISVVKIKNLLLLLQRLTSINSEYEKQNINFYYKGNDFPKFYFPYHFNLDNRHSFKERKDKDMTFNVPGYTPQKVCEEFFVYVKKLIDEKIGYLANYNNLEINGIEYSLVYPAKVGDEFIKEYERIITKVFAKPKVVISSIKAVSMYAYHKKYFNENEPILFFDMGEGDISVAKAKVVKDAEFNGVAIDAADGHLLPIEIGGDDIDSAIVNYLESSIEKRETIGSPTYGQVGHIMEKGLHSKQYLLMKNVKKAKMILSKETYKRNLFQNGVPITIVRDVIVQRNLTKEELKECIGITHNDGVARKIVDYIIEELRLGVNDDVRKVIISGGLIETYGLFEYIQKEVGLRMKRNISLYTIETKAEDNSLFPIRSFEDSTYAACLGGAVVNLMKYKLKMSLALSYGSFLYASGYGRVLNLFAEKGKIIKDEGEFLYVTYNSAQDEYQIEDEEFYSINITSDQIRNKYKSMEVDYCTLSYRTVLVVGKNGGSYQDRERRRKVEKLFGLKVVTGGAKATIRYYYKGSMVKLINSVNFKEGVLIDKNGFCRPHIENNVNNNTGMVKIGYLVVGFNGKPEKDAYGDVRVYKEEYVYASLIEPRFEGLDTFDAV